MAAIHKYILWPDESFRVKKDRVIGIVLEIYQMKIKL